MSRVITQHPDHFTLLSYSAGELATPERGATDDHLGACRECQTVLAQLSELDRQLSNLAKNPMVRCEWQPHELLPEDPFHRRPSGDAQQRRRLPTSDAVRNAIKAADQAMSLRDAILSATKDAKEPVIAILETLSLGALADRFALLYALQEAGRQIAADPARFLALAEATIMDLRHDQEASAAELVVPRQMLLAQAHQLAGQAQLWSGDLESAAAHFQTAYQAFGSLGEETSMARVEQLESQRRFFAAQGTEALVLAGRAKSTFAALGLDDEWARARGAEGMALFQLERWQESADAFTEALPVFEHHGLWSNYVGTLNSIGNALVKMGRLSEARREYAKALRRLSRQEHRSWLPFIRKGLAEALFSAGRYRQAAVEASQAARLYNESGQVSRFLMALLFEVESWARAGDSARARHRLELFRAAISRHDALDPTLAGLVHRALSGTSTDFSEIVNLREHADEVFQDRFGASA